MGLCASLVPLCVSSFFVTQMFREESQCFTEFHREELDPKDFPPDNYSIIRTDFTATEASYALIISQEYISLI
jgi:hypothetical protein